MKRDIYQDKQYYKFSAYGFLKNLRFFEPFFVLALLSRGIDYLQIGSLYAIREVTVNILELPTGILADGWGRKKTMMASFLSYIIAFLLLYRFEAYPLLAGAMVFYAFGDACRTGTHKSMIFDYIKRNGWVDLKSDYYGHTRAWAQRGSALSALIAGILVFSWKNYNAVFLFSIIPYVLDFILIGSYPGYLDRGAAHSGGVKHIIRDSFRTLKNKTVLKKTLSISLFTGYYKAVKDYLQPILQAAALAFPLLPHRTDEENSALVIGLVYFVIFIFTSHASASAGKVKRKIRSTSRVLLGSLLLGASAGVVGGLLYHYGHPWIAAALFLFVFVLENIRKPIGLGSLAEDIDSSILATVLSVESQEETIWTALFALGMGAVAQFVSLPAALAICSGLMLVVTVLLSTIKPKKAVPVS
ncbi:MAG: MFS transporter [Spirochaetales bacterium]|nr:MFS transporter [Spirochaetales bacterium]